VAWWWLYLRWDWKIHVPSRNKAERLDTLSL